MKKAKFIFYDYQAINVLLEDEKPSGGAAVQAMGWMHGLMHEGHEVYLITYLNGENNIKEECKAINLQPLFDYRKGVRWLRWVYYRIPYVYNQLNQLKPDYFYQGIPSWHSFLFGVICRRLNIKFIQRISNDNLLDERVYKNHSKLHRYFLKKGLELTYCILCQNEYQLAVIKKEFPNKKVLKITNPFYYNIVNTETEEKSRTYIAWLGLFQYQKNLKLLLEIAKMLDQEKFLIAGSNSVNIDPDTVKYLEELQGLPNVTFVGYLNRKQIFTFLSQAKFLLNTSHYEGFSNTFLEAMAVGTPILSSEKVNPDGIISKNGLGIVYKHVPDLKNQLDNSSQISWEAMSVNCKSFIHDNHDYRKLTKRLLEFLSVEK